MSCPLHVFTILCAASNAGRVTRTESVSLDNIVSSTYSPSQPMGDVLAKATEAAAGLLDAGSSSKDGAETKCNQILGQLPRAKNKLFAAVYGYFMGTWGYQQGANSMLSDIQTTYGLTTRTDESARDYSSYFSKMKNGLESMASGPSKFADKHAFYADVAKDVKVAAKQIVKRLDPQELALFQLGYSAYFVQLVLLAQYEQLTELRQGALEDGKDAIRACANTISSIGTARLYANQMKSLAEWMYHHESISSWPLNLLQAYSSTPQEDIYQSLPPAGKSCRWEDTLPSGALGNEPHTVIMSASISSSTAPAGRQWLLNLGQDGQWAHHWLWAGGNKDILMGAWSDPGGGRTGPVSKVRSTLASRFDGNNYAVFGDGKLISSRNGGVKFNIKTDKIWAGLAPIALGGKYKESNFKGCIKRVMVIRGACNDKEVEILSEILRRG